MTTTDLRCGRQPGRGLRLRPGSLFAGRFLIQRVITITSMSITYLAREQHEERLVVVKQLLLNEPGASFRAATALTRFRREAHLLAALRHPQLPRLRGAFRFGKAHFIVMAYVAGRRLDELIEDGIPDLKTALAIAEQLCAAVAFLHSQPCPVIHADLKPENVIVTPDGRVVVIDLGLSRPVTPRQWDEEPAGTLPYAPREQRRGEPLDERSDIYALGVTLDELFAATPGGTVAASVVARATALARSDRYGNVGQLARSLRAACTPMRRREPSPWARARARRARTGLVVIGIALSVVFGLLVLLWAVLQAAI